MSALITTSKEFRAEVLRGDKAMLRQLSKAYEQVERALKFQFESLMRDIAEAQRAGKTVNADWLRRSFRYQQLINQAKFQVNNFANSTNRFIQGKQQSAIELGQFHATGLIEAALPEISFARLPTEAINELIGTLEDGTPLSKVLDRLGGRVARDIKDALVSGLASGHGAATIARGIRQAIDVPRWKALQIARTTVMRSYRAATLRTYQENADVIASWTWISTQSIRTCPSCWALHGKVFPVSKTFFPAHVSCRCTSIPNVKGSTFNVQSGSELFAEIPVAQQQIILGPSRWEMWASGEVESLMDFTILTRDRDWGPAYQVRPLYQLKKRRAA